MTRMQIRRASSLLLAAALLTTAGCASAGADGPGGTVAVRFALDWTPNTNHTGLYVAIEKGYFAEEGIEVEVLPFAEALPDQLIDAGGAEFGISKQDETIFAQAAGADVVSVLAPLQHWATAIGVRADDDSITRPSDLDGKVFAGFGTAYEAPLLEQVIRADGGKGDFERVTLGATAYEALYAGEADFAIPYLAWEGIEAERAGTPMRFFHYTDVGFPDQYAVTIDANRDWLEENPDAARGFVTALQRGYEDAAADPDEAARILIDQNPGVFADEELVLESQRMLADDMVADDGTVGTMTEQGWAGYADFLFDAGLLADENGERMSERPDWSTFFTDEYLSR